MTSQTDEQQPPTAAHDDRAVRIGNLVVWGLVATLATLLGVHLIPLTTAGGTRIPIAPLVPLAAHIALPRILYRATGWRWATFIPAAIWALISLAGAAPTSGGDLLIPGNSYSSVIGLAYLAVGAMSAIIGIVMAKMAPRASRGRSMTRLDTEQHRDPASRRRGEEHS